MENTHIPLYMQIVEEIKGKILAGEFRANDRIPSENEIKVRYKVSRITSKKALECLEAEGYIYRKKGSGSYVSGYKQGGQDISWSSGKFKSVDVIIPFDASLWQGMRFLQGISDCLQKFDIPMKIKSVGSEIECEHQMLLSQFQEETAGTIIYPIFGNRNIDAAFMLYNSGLPFVAIDKQYDGIDMPSVVSDNYGGAYQLAEHLLKNGHRQIAFVSEIGLENASSVRDRFFGYCTALKDYKIKPNPANIVLDYYATVGASNSNLLRHLTDKSNSFDSTHCEFYQSLLAPLLQQETPVTAILATNDTSAMYWMKSALATGIRVPEDLSIVGFDNIDFSQHLPVPLTTVEQDFYQIGYRAAELLHNKIQKKKNLRTKLSIPTKLIIRDSVGTLPPNE